MPYKAPPPLACYSMYVIYLLCFMTPSLPPSLLLLSLPSPSFLSSQGIQDLLICLEMLVAAVFFFYAFPLSDYLKSPQDSQASPSPTRQAEQHGVGFHSGGEGESRVEGPLPGVKVSCYAPGKPLHCILM